MSVKNRTIFTGDCLDIMRGMADGCIDLIYLDPPFNSNANYAAPIGSEAAGAEFKDTWGLSDIDLAWWGEIEEAYPALYKLLAAVREVRGKSMMAYLIYMAIRVIEMRRLLKPTGSIYLHCDPTASHYLKLMMDSIFSGGGQMQNEIVWCYGSGGASKKRFSRKHDTVFFYTLGREYLFNVDSVREPYSSPHKSMTPKVVGSKVYQKMHPLGRIPFDWWQIPILTNSDKQRTGYPTQKPLALLQRIIKASSNQGDIILDPFCGCATTCVAAEVESRQWIGIDVSDLAFQLVKTRLKNTLPSLDWEVIHRTDTPTDRVGKRSKDIKHTLYGRQEGACNGCLSWFPFRNMTLDHLIPRVKGGADTDDNLQLLCGACNSKKGDRPMEELIAALAAEGIRQ